MVLGIAPWNAPVILGVRAIAMPLACGNTVVLKASEMCPGTHRLIGELFREAGFPPGVVNVVTNAPEDAGEVVEALIAHPAVRRVNFTGSSRVGKIIARKCAEYLKPVLLELGGKSPLVVLDDADLDEAVKAAAFGAFANQGQICMSTERIVVDEKVADEFVARFAAKAEIALGGRSARGQGDPGLGGGPCRRRARHLAGAGRAWPRAPSWWRAASISGTLIGAHVLDHVTPAMRIYDEESFGPVTTVVRAKGEDEAVRIANDTRLRALLGGVQPRHHPRLRGGAAARVRHLPHQRADGARRGADAVRRREGSRLRPLRRQGGASTSSPSCAGSPSSPATGTIRSEWVGGGGGPGFVHDACCRRHSSGERPTHFLKARLNAASDSKPTAAATETTLAPSSRKQSTRQLHAQLPQVLHRRLTDEMHKAFGQHRARCTSLCRERIQRPALRRGIVQQRQRARDQRIAQPGEPAGLLTGQCFEVTAHDVHEQQLGHPQLHNLSARAVLAQLVQRERDQMRQAVPRLLRRSGREAGAAAPTARD